MLPRRRRIYRAACVDIRMCAFTPHALAHLSLSPKLYILTYARAAQRSCMGQVTAHVCMHKHGVCALSACVFVCLPVPFAYARDLTFRLAANAIALASQSLQNTHIHRHVHTRTRTGQHTMMCKHMRAHGERVNTKTRGGLSDRVRGRMSVLALGRAGRAHVMCNVPGQPDRNMWETFIFGLPLCICIHVCARACISVCLFVLCCVP